MILTWYQLLIRPLQCQGLLSGLVQLDPGGGPPGVVGEGDRLRPLDGAESAVPHPWVPPLQQPLQQGPVAVDLESAGATVLAEAEAVHLQGVAGKLPDIKGQKYRAKYRARRVAVRTAARTKRKSSSATSAKNQQQQQHEKQQQQQQHEQGKQ